MSSPDQEPMLDIARGDPARSRFLRAALTRLRDTSGDERFHTMVDDILAGRRSLRDAATSEVFNRGIADKVDEGARRYQELSEAEREALAAMGEQQFAELRGQAEPGPAADAAPDEDDDDFGDESPLRRN
jgi:hypothetical protein